MTQLALGWDTGRARRDDPATSVAAAAAVDVPRRAGEVLAVLRQRQAATAQELAFVLFREGAGWAMPNVVSRRLLDLERRDLARRVGEVCGMQGRNVTLWEAA